MKRLNLEKGYLVNKSGAICKRDSDKGRFYCGNDISNYSFETGKDHCSLSRRCVDCETL